MTVATRCISPRVVQATWDHVAALAPRLRIEHVKEVAALDGSSAREALERSFRLSDAAYTVLLDGKVIAIFGTAPSGVQGYGIVWLLGSAEIDLIGVRFAKESIRMIREALQRYEVLCNVVDARYKTALRWIEWCGARTGATERLGNRGMRFVPFVIDRKVWRWAR